MKRRKKTEESPIYPHSKYIAELYGQMDTRRLTELEARTLLNARVFGSILEVWMPELREILKEMKEGDRNFENAQLLIAQAAMMAQALGTELIIAKAEASRLHLVTEAEVKRLLAEVKS